MKIPKVKQLPSGSYTYQLMVDGRRISFTRQTEKEVIAEVMAYKNGYKKMKNNPEGITLGEAMIKFNDVNDGVLSPSTIRGYDSIRRNNLEKLQKMKLGNITNDIIQKEISMMVKQDKSPKYIKNVVGYLSSVMKMYYPEFQMRVSTPQKQKIEYRELSVDEIQKIMKIIQGTSVEVPTLLALWCGLRMSEILGLTTDCIKNHKIHVKQAMVYDKDRNMVLKGTKTFSGDRWISLPEYIESKIDMSKEKITDLKPSTIVERLDKICENNGIEHFRFHDLRHANAAVMARLAISPKYAQERNGWSDHKMYLNLYSFVQDDQMQKVDQTINEFFESQLKD